MQRKDNRVWSAHTSKSCNMSKTVKIIHNGTVIGTTCFNPDKKNNPRAWVEFAGEVIINEKGETCILIG